MQKAAYAYLSTQVTTTDKGDLLLLLYEGAIKFLKQAKTKMEERDYAQKGILISRALDVIAELDGSLNAEKGGELAQNLHNLYFYCNTRLLQANLRLNTTQVDEVIRILESLKEAFTQISKSKLPSSASTVHLPEDPGAGGEHPAAAARPPLFSIGKGSSGPAPAAHVVAATMPAYRPAAPASPAAKPAPAPPAAAPSPISPAAAAAAKPTAPAAPAPAPQPAPQVNSDLARVKALHRAYGRYGTGN